ncbi:MAG: hypothetical protein ACE15D_02890 [Candidatus Eisenbacteria bacterium]
MTGRAMFFGLLVALVAALAPITAQSQEMVYFKGHAEGTIDHAPSVACGTGFLEATTQASGNVSHMGRVDIEGLHCLNPSSGEVSNGDFTIATKGGDMLYATYTGQAFPDQTVRLEGTWTGGTGRFAGATGQFVVTATKTVGDIWHSQIVMDAVGTVTIIDD